MLIFMFLVGALNISYGQIWLDIEVWTYASVTTVTLLLAMLLNRKQNIGVTTKKKIKCFLKNYYQQPVYVAMYSCSYSHC